MNPEIDNVESNTTQENVFWGCEDIEDIVRIVAERGVIEGSSGSQNSEYIITQINELLSNIDKGKYDNDFDNHYFKADLIYLTRGEGLREAVENVLCIQIVRRQRKP